MIDDQFVAYDAQCATAARLRAEILPQNKQVLFDVLSAAGIEVVTINFEGSSDSGQFDAACAFDAQGCKLAIPNGLITVKSVDFETGTVCGLTIALPDYIETLACDFLEGTHDGWENEDGAHGEFRFSVSERTITLDYNERYVDYNYHQHEF